jgi:hypothetical protein
VTVVKSVFFSVKSHMVGGIGTASGTGGEVKRAPANLAKLEPASISDPERVEEEKARSLSDPDPDELSEPETDVDRTFIFLL